MLRLLFGLLLCSLLVLPGCGKKEPVKPAAVSTTPSPKAAVKLTILVVGDAELAAGIRLLRGEWAERSGGELEVRESETEDFLGGEPFSADVVVCASRYLGTLVERKLLRPVRNSVLEDEKLDLQDIFPVLRNRMMRFGGETFGISLGEPPLMLAWEGELPAKMAPGSPITWKQFDQFPVRRSTEPRLEFPRATALIVRAVAYSNLRRVSAVLFDPQTMKPQLAEPPFVRALEELVALENAEAPDGEATTVKLSWPTATVGSESGETERTRSFTGLASADKVYDRSFGTWSSDNGAGESPTFLGFSGRIVSVSKSSRNAVSAFKLLRWLASGETAVQISQRSGATIWFRRSQVAQSSNWLRGRNVTEETADTVTKLLTHDQVYVLPRVPGIDEYLRSLDKLLEKRGLSGISEEGAVEQALGEAVSRWQTITESYGREHQREAYAKHLGFGKSVE